MDFSELEILTLLTCSKLNASSDSESEEETAKDTDSDIEKKTNLIEKETQMSISQNRNFKQQRRFNTQQRRNIDIIDKFIDSDAFAKCDFEDPSICNFVQDTTDDFNWKRRSASTPSANTGPSFDHTYGTCKGGYYLHIEATGQNSNDIARLWTPSYPSTNGLCIKWFYHMYGDSVNTLNVYVVDSSGNVGSPVWTRTNNQGNFWILGQVTVTTSGIYKMMLKELGELILQGTLV
ncbi:enteropeptidase-like [Anneissia japonica]|uniref:enteropeptidase-like n=1 Tax=Anneissia japonica TaxID=1529436 RepID=UPI001425B82A|nr:enteropeptidase-like [Anneissia japonica]